MNCLAVPAFPGIGVAIRAVTVFVFVFVVVGIVVAAVVKKSASISKEFQSVMLGFSLGSMSS